MAVTYQLGANLLFEAFLLGVFFGVWDMVKPSKT